MSTLSLFALVSTLAAIGIALLWWQGRQRITKLSKLLRQRSNNLEELQLAFERFAPGEIVEQILSSGEATYAERKESTVLFADLVGFTEISERLEPDQLVQILNGYFERMSRVISKHRGHLSTLIGDGILALFGSLEPNPWQGIDAVRAALAMQEELDHYNKVLEKQELPQLKVGIGLHRGVGIAALVGSNDLMQFTLVGRVVNLAARIQDLTRQCDADILVSAELRNTLDDRFCLRELDAVKVKGIEEPVPIFAVDDFCEE